MCILLIFLYHKKAFLLLFEIFSRCAAFLVRIIFHSEFCFREIVFAKQIKPNHWKIAISFMHVIKGVNKSPIGISSYWASVLSGNCLETY